MVISRSSYGRAEQALIVVNSLYDGAQKQQKLCIFIGRITWGEQVYSGVCREGPVVVLAAAVDTGKGFFMEQAYKTVAGRYLLHDLHCELILVCGKVACGVYGGKLMLCRRNFIVLSLGEDTQFPQLFVQFFHICCHPRLDCAEIVVVHFLAFGRLCTKKSAAGVYKVLALFVHFSVNEKILLLRANRGDNPLYTVVAEKP